MPRGASPKREREYKQLERKFERSGRYRGREKEVAARVVNKQRARFGEAKGAKSRTKSRAKSTSARRTSRVSRSRTSRTSARARR